MLKTFGLIFIFFLLFGDSLGEFLVWFQGAVLIFISMLATIGFVKILKFLFFVFIVRLIFQLFWD